MSEPLQIVFVVDDDPAFLTSMSRWLNAFGYSVESYSSAMDFLTQRPKQATGCVITDLRMPGMGGMDLQQALAQSGNPLPGMRKSVMTQPVACFGLCVRKSIAEE